ncbi:MAG: ABC transporter permease [Deltaproteobacteria bacterium]|nr:ABC transporter permease [Deltaproteobacteria bacterium]
MELRRYLINRTIQIIITFFFIMTLLFILFRIAPGDPSSMIIDPHMTPEDVALIRQQFGLDQPIYVQYLVYIKNFFKGDFGISFYYGEPVLNVIKSVLPNTLLLFTSATILSALAGISWGKFAAWKKGSVSDVALTLTGLIAHTLFLPWFALIMIWIFSYKLELFPLNGMVSPEIWLDPECGFWAKSLDVLHHLFLPLLVLFIIHFGGFLLVMRSSMLEVVKEDFILTARAKGLTDREIRNHHAAPNAALPVITNVGLSLAFSINGGALTETVFSWPGLGRELVNAVSQFDYPLAQMSFLIISALVLASNLVVDVLYAYLDPRIRY